MKQIYYYYTTFVRKVSLNKLVKNDRIRGSSSEHFSYLQLLCRVAIPRGIVIILVGIAVTHQPSNSALTFSNEFTQFC